MSGNAWKGLENTVEREELDGKLRKTIQRQGVMGCAVTEIQKELGDIALIRTGMLLAENKLRVVGGGGQTPYRVALNNVCDYTEVPKGKGL
jgi:hypothetical protein